MITTDFNQNFNFILREVELTRFEINNKRFSSIIRIIFNESLENLLRLLNREKSSIRFPSQSWQVADQIVKLGAIYDKIKFIYVEILVLPIPKYFCKKIPHIVLPSLVERIQALNQYIGTLGRLPFVVGEERNEFYERVKKSLSIKIPTQITPAEKEYFHLLGDELDDRQLTSINLHHYEGFFEVYSLESWSRIISRFIRVGTDQERVIGSVILNILKKAQPIALKTSFVYYFPQMTKLNQQLDHSYYQDFIKTQLKYSDKTIQTNQEKFDNKYILNKNCPIPSKAIINEIAWDMLEKLDQLRVGQTQLFMLGLRLHSIAVTVMCSSLSLSGKQYVYKIYNTSKTGVCLFHRTKRINQKIFARPFVIRQLHREAFSYLFMEKLVAFTYSSFYKERQFYELHHEFLIETAGGIKDLDSEKWYPIQKHGICSYTSVEAWIKSYLSEGGMRHLAWSKALYAVNKQQKIVNFWKAKAPSPFTKRKQETNQLLLTLGKEYIDKIKPFHHSRLSIKRWHDSIAYLT